MCRNRKPVALAMLVVLSAFALSATPAAAERKKHPGPITPGRGNDRTPPTISCPDGITVDAMGPIGAYVTYTVTATDNSDPSPDVTISHPSGSTFPIGTTTVTVTATDWKLNSATSTFDVTVLPPPEGSSFSYRMEWWTYDWDGNVVVAYEWNITVSADGTVSGSGEQKYLLEEYAWWGEEYAIPMPQDLVGSGELSGTISSDGSSTLDVSQNYWTLEKNDYGDEGVLSEWTYDFSGTVQASMNANGDLVFSGPYYGFWVKN